MVNAYDVPASDLIDAVAKELKKNDAMKPPEWMVYAKSGAHAERPPQDDDFWYIRGASILRKIYVRGTLGTERLRTEYGGKKNRGSKPEQHRKSSGSVIRKLLQQLEAAGYLKKEKVGRVISPTGQKLLDNTAYAVFKKPKTKEEAVVAVKEKAKEIAEKLPEEKQDKPKIKEEKPKKEKKEEKEAKPEKKEKPKKKE
jgi:small subunit ribosomal protein S19e